MKSHNNTNNNNNKKKKTSYGIICISKDGFIVLNQSPPYITTKLMRVNNKYDFLCNVTLNEKYNLDISMFPDTCLEGEYTLPKGHIDKIDRNKKYFTKVREFIEETKYTHPYFKYVLEQHFQNPNFKSFLNDEKYIIREKWKGLDNKIYNCEYSVFCIENLKELIPVELENNVVPFNFFVKNFSFFRQDSKYCKRYQQSCKWDSLKKTKFLKISEGIELINQHKINISLNNNNNNNNDHYNDSRINEKNIKEIINAVYLK